MPDPSPPPRRRCRRGWTTGPMALLLALAALPAAVAARPLELEITPQAPTWAEPVWVTVRGSGCAPQLGAFAYAGSGEVWEAPLLETCVPGQQPAAFVASRSVALPGPGQFTLRVRDVDGSAASRRVDVYDVTAIGVDAPKVVEAGAPFRVGLTFRAGCAYLGDEREGNVIEILVAGGCVIPVPPPPVVVHEIDYELRPLLEPGRYEIRVLDTTSGFHPFLRGLARRDLLVVPEGACLPGPDVLCLHDGRFRVTATWRDFTGGEGVAHPLDLDGDDTSGLLWFFGPANVELTVKVLDGCGYNGHWWVFVASGSTVGYDLTVTDTRSGESRTYSNEPGEVPRLVADTAALEVCP